LILTRVEFYLIMILTGIFYSNDAKIKVERFFA